jgi:hypothetical protein
MLDFFAVGMSSGADGGSRSRSAAKARGLFCSHPAGSARRVRSQILKGELIYFASPGISRLHAFAIELLITYAEGLGTSVVCFSLCGVTSFSIWQAITMARQHAARAAVLAAIASRIRRSCC